MPGAPPRTPDVRFQSSCFALEDQNDPLETSERTDSLRSRPPRSAPRGAHYGRDHCRGARHEGHKYLLIDLAPSQQQYLVRGHRATERTSYDAIAEPVCDLARIIQPAPMLQNRLIAKRLPSPNARARLAGEPWRTSDEGADRLAGSDDHARRYQLFAESRAVDDQCSGGREARPASAFEGTDDLLETFLRSRQPSNPGPSHSGAWRPSSGSDPAAALSASLLELHSAATLQNLFVAIYLQGSASQTRVTWVGERTRTSK